MATLIPNTYRRSGMYYARFRLPKILHPHAERIGLPKDICSGQVIPDTSLSTLLEFNRCQVAQRRMQPK
jgi:hypothetical protein